MAKHHEFINPKSMLTPGALAAIVATIAGALFSWLGITLPVILIVLSFLFGAVVFDSKEFADPQMKRTAKWLYYVLNSLIIFGMATGTHSVLDKRGRTSATNAGLLIITSAFAQETTQDTPVLKQERPFFYDWTRHTPYPATRLVDKGIVTFKTEKGSGTLTGYAANLGLVKPTYKVQLEIDKAKLPGEVKSVTWHLPAAYFAKDRVTVSKATENFGVNIDAWKPFAIKADIELKSGEKVVVEKLVSFEAKKD